MAGFPELNGQRCGAAKVRVIFQVLASARRSFGDRTPRGGYKSGKNQQLRSPFGLDAAGKYTWCRTGALPVGEGV